jgi:hypothetical protein
MDPYFHFLYFNFTYYNFLNSKLSLKSWNNILIIIQWKCEQCRLNKWVCRAVVRGRASIGPMLILSNIYIFIPASGCVGRGAPVHCFFRGVYNAVKTARVWMRFKLIFPKCLHKWQCTSWRLITVKIFTSHVMFSIWHDDLNIHQSCYVFHMAWWSV